MRKAIFTFDPAAAPALIFSVAGVIVALTAWDAHTAAAFAVGALVGGVRFNLS